jgi:hypothetical protein
MTLEQYSVGERQSQNSTLIDCATIKMRQKETNPSSVTCQKGCPEITSPESEARVSQGAQPSCGLGERHRVPFFVITPLLRVPSMTLTTYSLLELTLRTQSVILAGAVLA